MKDLGRVKSKTAFWVLTFFAVAAAGVALRELASNREAAKLFATGARATGRCEALSKRWFSYRFEASGKSFDAHNRPVPREPLQVGQPIEVRYDPADPSRNVSEFEKPAPGGAILLFGFAAAFFAGGLFLLRVGGIPTAYRR
ncbi:MAG TPA: DUF3592 domain-containing protein [Planctomycetota bacterium]